MSDKPGKNTDAWLEDESTVSRAYGELQKPGPPPRLDEKILAEARRAVDKTDNVVIRVQHWRKWTMPAALAATVVFAVPLVVRVFDTMSPDFEANQRPAMTMSDKTSMETGAAEANRDVSGPGPATPAAISTEALVGMRTLPAAPEQSPARPLMPPVSRTDAESLPAEEPKLLARKAEPSATEMDRPATDLGKSGRLTMQTEMAEVAADEVFAAAPPRSQAGQTASSMNDAADAAQPTDLSPAYESLAAATDESYREKGSRSDGRQAAELTQEGTNYGKAQTVAASAGLDMAGEEEPGNDGVREPQQWLDDIAEQHRRGLIRTARRALGSFLTTYPDYPLADDYPLQAEDALYDNETAGHTSGDNDDIVPEAAAWLRGIGLMAERGDLDQARTQLAEFFEIFPDYPLPADFPLTRDDARPIER